MASIAACGELQHENPFDPQTPPDRQARTSFSGTVSLEPVGGVTPSLAGIPVSVAGQGYISVTDASGNYVINGVPPGSYTVQAVLTDYDTTSVTGVTATLDTGGGTVAVPPLAMKRVRADLFGTVDLKLPDNILETTGGASVSIAAAAGGGAAPAGLFRTMAVSRALTSGSAGTALTDSAGDFVITGVPAPIGSYTLTASKFGYVAQTSTVTFTGGAFVVQTVQLLIDPGAIVGSVLVVGADFSSGVTVRARGTTLGGTPWEDVTLTDAVGAFRISGLPAGTYNVTYELADHATVSTSAAVAPGADTTLPPAELVRDTGSAFGVARLQGAADNSGIQVTITASPPPVDGSASGAAVTDTFGNWRVDGLPVGEYTIAFDRQPGYGSRTATVAVASRRAVAAFPADVTLPVVPATVSGRVLLEGLSAPNLFDTNVLVEGTSTPVKTIADGSYVIDPAPTGPQMVRFYRSGFETQKAQVTLSPGQATALFDVVLQRSRGSIAGAFTLNGPAGISSAGIVVTATSGSTTASTVTDQYGQFTLSGLAVGNWTVSARRDPDWSPIVGLAATVEPSATTELAAAGMDPRSSASINGVALLEGGGTTGNANTIVTLTGTDFRGLTVTRPSQPTDSAGIWSFGALVAGSYQIAFTQSDFESPSPVSASLQTAQTADAGTVNLAKSRGSIAGTFTLSGAASSAGVVVTATSGSSTASTVTNSAGAFSFTGLAVGAWTVSARLDPDWTPITGVAAAVARNDITPVTPAALSPVATASISGAALLEGGADPRSISVSLIGTDFRGQGVSRSTSPTNLAGIYSFAGLVGGSYQVAFTQSGYETPASAGVSVQTGAAVAIGEATLALSRGAIGGTFALASLSSAAGIVVTATNGTAIFSTVAGSTGAVTLTGLPIGTYTVTARLDPDWQASTTGGVVVTRNVTTPVSIPTITLTPFASSTISGVALLEGGGTTGNANTIVTLTGTDFRGVAVAAGTTTATDASGSWNFSALRAGSYQIAFTQSGYETPASAGVSVSTGQAASLGSLTLAASRGGAGGTVTATGAANDAGTVVEIAGGPDAATAVTNATGAWQVTGLRVSSSYTATYRRTGYVTPAATPFSVASGWTTPVAGAVLSVATTASITGVATVARPAGAAASAGILVSLTGTDLNGASVTRSTNTVSGGGFTLSSLPQGTYNLAFTKANYAPASVSAVVTRAGSSTSAQPVVLPVGTGVVSGAVKVSAGTVAGFTVETNLSGIVLSLSESGVEVVPPAVTDATGSYSFQDVPAAVSGVAYVVTAQKPYYLSNTGSVSPAGGASNPVADITLTVNAGSLSAFAWNFDNLQHNDTVNANSSSVRVVVSGTAFNGTSWGMTVYTVASGSWSVAQIPAGTWSAVATSTDRACASIPSVVVGAGEAVSAASIRCTDTGAPTAPVLTTPAGTDGQVGFTRLSSIGVPVATDAIDVVNLRGYQAVKGATPDWNGAPVVAVPPVPTVNFTGLATNAANVLWVRAIDWVGNAGPAASVTVVQDGLATALSTTIETPRSVVDATTTSVTLRGAEGDANFLSYQSCGWSQAATVNCPSSCTCSASGSCTCSGLAGSGPGGVGLATCTLDESKAVPAAFAVSLPADQRTCLLARAVDRAGNAGAVAIAAVTSDLTPPSTVVFAPSFDPTLVTVHADFVDFFLKTAPTDGPAGGATPWKNVSHLEADTGTGYTPLCPATACHPNDTFDPCAVACGCSDDRLLCSGTSFLGIRMRLLGGVANDFMVRAVDTAGNRGAGLAQQIVTAGSGRTVQATSTWDLGPRPLGRLLTVSGMSATKLYELGSDQQLNAGDTSCDIGVANGIRTYPSAQPASATLVVYAASSSTMVKARRAGVSGLCSTFTETTIRTAPYGSSSIFGVAASGERAAWSEQTSTLPNTYKTYVQEPGSDGLLGGAGSPAVTEMGSFASPAPIQLQGSALLEYGTRAGVTAWKVWNAVGGVFSPNDLADTTRSYTFPTGIAAVGLSSDGKTLATFTSSGGVMSIRKPATSTSGFVGTGDRVVSHTFGAGTVTSGSVMAVEGSHAVAFDSATPNYVYHWYAGGDGTFGTTDDTYAKLLPSSMARVYPALGDGLANGILYFQIGRTNTGEDPDVWSFDLGAFRWDSPVTTVTSSVVTNGAGALFVHPASGGTACRTSDGRHALLGSAIAGFDADGADLVAFSSRSVMHYGPDSTGLWFTSGSQPALAVFTTPTSTTTVSQVAVGEGRVLLKESDGTLRILLPSGGSLRTGQTVVTLAQVTGAPPNSREIGIAGPHAIYGCESTMQYVCYAYAGPDAIFGTGDDVAPVILKDKAGFAYIYVQTLRAQGDRIYVNANHGGRSLVLDAGSDGMFGTSDDVERAMPALASFSGAYDLAGDLFAWTADVPGSGLQVFVKNIVSGEQRQLTSHYSYKVRLALDPTGRTWWQDYVFAQPIVFVSSP